MKRYIIIILLFLFHVSCAVKELKPFSFVQMCDTQLGMGGYEQDIQAFKQAVKQINVLNPDFVIICGDLVNNPSASSFPDFIEVKESLNMLCYCVAGNHDIGVIPNDTTLSYFRNTFGNDYYTFQHKGYSFIVTNTQLWKEDVENESAKHDIWFKETLIAKGDKKNRVFVIGHYPLYIDSCPPTG